MTKDKLYKDAVRHLLGEASDNVDLRSYDPQNSRIKIPGSESGDLRTRVIRVNGKGLHQIHSIIQHEDGSAVIHTTKIHNGKPAPVIAYGDRLSGHVFHSKTPKNIDSHPDVFRQTREYLRVYKKAGDANSAEELPVFVNKEGKKHVIRTHVHDSGLHEEQMKPIDENDR